MFQGVLVGPPDPLIFGPEWKQEWLKRLHGMPAVLAEWVNHQRFDAYWQRESVGLDYSRIKCPVYCVGGWEDAYNNSIARALSELAVPRKGLIGPWAHLFPPDGSPGPALDWVHEEVRWWEHWLKGIETGIMAEPMFRFYMPERKASEVYPKDTPGRWVAEDVWPSARIKPAVFYLTSGALASIAGPPEEIRYKANKIVGLRRMEWVPFSMQNDLAKEQTPDDKNSVGFDSAPLESDLEIAGHPLVRLRVSADVPVAAVAVRLTELTTEGQSWQVTYGLLNLTHRVSHEHPTALVPGEVYDVEIPLNLIAHQFKKGNRIRVALSESLWPLVWPSPKPATLTFIAGASSLMLPVRPPRQPEPPFTIPSLPGAGGPDRGGGTLTVTGPDAAGRVVIDHRWPDDTTLLNETHTTVGSGWRHWHMEFREGHPTSCRWQGDFGERYERADWGTNLVLTRFELSSTVEAFQLKESIRATHDGAVVFERQWNSTIRRDLM